MLPARLRQDGQIAVGVLSEREELVGTLISRTLSVCGELAERLKTAVC